MNGEYTHPTTGPTDPGEEARVAARGRWLCAVLLAAHLPLAIANPGSNPALEEDNVRFEWVGSGSFRWKKIFHAYDATLHAGPGIKPEAILGGGPVRLEIQYHRDFTARDIVSGGNALLRQNVSNEVWERVQPQLERLNQAYVNVRSGDRYTLTYVPGTGTTLRLNGRPLVTVEGAEFGTAYLRIWLGEAPISRDLRDSLLGKNRDKTP